MVKGGSKRLQVTGNYKGFPGLIKGYRGLQGITAGYKGLQDVKEGYNGLQGVTEKLCLTITSTNTFSRSILHETKN